MAPENTSPEKPPVSPINEGPVVEQPPITGPENAVTANTSPTPVNQPVAPAPAPTPPADIKMPWDTPSEGIPSQINPAQTQQTENVTSNAWMDISQKSPGRMKKTFLIVGSSLATVLLVGGFVFGYYIPNKPQNVYKTGLNRTGFVVNLVANQATKKENVQKITNTAFKSSLSVKTKTVSLTGTIDSKFDNTKNLTTIKGSFQEKGQPVKKIDINAMGEKAEKSALPNIFVKVIGLKDLKANSLLPGLEDYDGKWLTLDQAVWDKLGVKQDASTPNGDLTNEEVAQDAKALISVSSEYILSANKDKAVLENRKFIGKEKIDGITAHHYLVGFNQANAKAYCEKLTKTALDTATYSKLTGSKKSDIDKAKKNVGKDCKDIVKNNFKPNDTFDLWVNSSSKLIYKIRIKDKTDAKNYTEFGQTLKGRDQITVFITSYQNSNKGKFTTSLTTSIKTNKTTGEIKYSDKDNVNVRATFEFAPYNGKIDTKAPAGAIPSSELIKKLTEQTQAQTIADTASSAADTNTATDPATDPSIDASIPEDYTETDIYLPDSID